MRALAPHFGRMRGQHRADQRAVEEIASAPAPSNPASRARSNAWRSEPGRGAERSTTWARLRRMWCWSSAMLARCEK